MKHATSLGAAFVLALLPTLHAGDFDAQREQVLALGKLTAAPATHDADGFPAEGGMKAVFFDALPWKGKPTRVFAWMGMPAKSTGKVPAMVLVHGGGGTAHKQWVEMWTARGFAAISIAVEGQTDQPGGLGASGRRTWKSHEWAGPARNGIYGDSSEPLADQWMYHAVADCILANSLLRSLPDVDAEKIGLMGFSWGGVITSTVIGIDPRFAFAVPVYGCGHLADAENQYGRNLGKNDLYQKVWDPVLRADRVKIPVLWLSWPEDQHFPMDCLAATYQAMSGPRMVSLIPKMGHGGGPSWTRPESYAFAESIVETGGAWCMSAQASAANGTATAQFKATRPLQKAELISTTGTGFTGARTWTGSPAALVEKDGTWLATSPLPAGTTAWFINVHSGGLVASSDYQEGTDDTP